MKNILTFGKKLLLSNYLYLFIYSIIFTLVSYLSINTASIIYDYDFHLARIIGLAQSIANKDILPNLNFLFLNGTGYGVPMFYGNWMFYLPALFFIKTKVATFAFAFFVWQSVLATVFITNYVLEKMTSDRLRSLLGAIAVSCSVTFFGFGMTAVVPLIPLLLYAIDKVIFKEQYNPMLLAIVISLLVQTHIISTIVLAIFSLVLVIFNLNQLTWKKIQSFICSIGLSLLLLAGFIFQYIEQSISQIFFVNWKLRDFPFPTESLMNPGDIWEILSNYYWPVIFIFIVLALVFFNRLDMFSRQLILMTLVMFLLSSNLIPWTTLRQTFLSVFQYTERLIYLLPVFVIIAIAKTAPRWLVIFVALIQVSIYLYYFPFSFRADTIPYADRGFKDSTLKIIDNNNYRSLESYYNPFEFTNHTSGDEYVNLDANHENLRNGSISKFEFDDQSVAIYNIKQSYNSLEFDVSLLNGSGDQTIVLPRIWYKGYVAQYLGGASGTQPVILYKDKSLEESKLADELGKPKTSQKALNDGKATIRVQSSGKVVISYHKTIVQIIGFTIELVSFIIIISYILAKKINDRQQLIL